MVTAQEARAKGRQAGATRRARTYARLETREGRKAPAFALWCALFKKGEIIADDTHRRTLAGSPARFSASARTSGAHVSKTARKLAEASKPKSQQAEQGDVLTDVFFKHQEARDKQAGRDVARAYEAEQGKLAGKATHYLLKWGARYGELLANTSPVSEG